MADTRWTPELASAMRTFKSRLTRAKGRKDWDAVIAVKNDFVAFFDAKGLPLPDNANLFFREADDAAFELRRAGDMGGWAWR